MCGYWSFSTWIIGDQVICEDVRFFEIHFPYTVCQSYVMISEFLQFSVFPEPFGAFSDEKEIQKDSYNESTRMDEEESSPWETVMQHPCYAEEGKGSSCQMMMDRQCLVFRM